MRYRITCADADRRAFVLNGIFPSDWAAIDYAVSQGALVALPKRVR
jgi:hypothetical protein